MKARWQQSIWAERETNPVWLRSMSEELERLALAFRGCGAAPGEHEVVGLSCACTGACSERRTLQGAALYFEMMAERHTKGTHAEERESLDEIRDLRARLSWGDGIPHYERPGYHEPGS